MEYLGRIYEICDKAELLNGEKNLLRDLTDPLYSKNGQCELSEIQTIISKLVAHEQCEKLAELIQEKWTHIETNPDAYDGLTDDVFCG